MAKKTKKENERMLFEVFLDLFYADEGSEYRVADAKTELTDAKTQQKRVKKALAKTVARYTELYGKPPSAKKGK